MLAYSGHKMLLITYWKQTDKEGTEMTSVLLCYRNNRLWRWFTQKQEMYYEKIIDPAGLSQSQCDLFIHLQYRVLCNRNAVLNHNYKWFVLNIDNEGKHQWPTPQKGHVHYPNQPNRGNFPTAPSQRPRQSTGTLVCDHTRQILQYSLHPHVIWPLRVPRVMFTFVDLEKKVAQKRRTLILHKTGPVHRFIDNTWQ